MLRFSIFSSLELNLDKIESKNRLLSSIFVQRNFYFFIFSSSLTIHRTENGHLKQCRFFGRMSARSTPTYRRDPGFSCIVAPPSFYSDRLTRPPTLLIHFLHFLHTNLSLSSPFPRAILPPPHLIFHGRTSVMEML